MITLGKEPLRWAMAVMLLACHSLAFAIREERTFEVTVNIPVVDYYVLPADPGFLERVQPMKWDFGTATLMPINALFDVRSTNSPITARLQQTPKLTSDRSDIELKVTFNHQLLSLTDTVVVPYTEAQAGLRVPLQIEAITPTGGYLSGNYYGAVTIIFDAQLI